MLCYRCGSHTPDGSPQCQKCGQSFAAKRSAPSKPRSQAKRPEGTAPYPVGEVLAGRFRVRGLLGQGPSGHVFRVTDVEARPKDADLALKVVHSRLLQTEADRSTFRRALEQARKIVHPKVCRVLEDGVLGDRLYYAMPLLQGLPLSRIIELRRAQRAFGLAECEPLVAQMAQALEHAARFLAHGGLRPENVIVQPDEIKIVDFATMTGLPRRPYLAMMGTELSYVAPELRGDGGALTPLADVFSIAVLLVEMLTGQRPDTVGHARPELGFGSAPPGLKALLGRALSPILSDRPPTPLAFHAELLELVDDPLTGPIALTAPLTLESMTLAEPVTSPVAIEGQAKRGELGRSEREPTPRAALARGDRREPLVEFDRTVLTRLSQGDAFEARSVVRRREARVSRRFGLVVVLAVTIVLAGLVGAALVLWARRPLPSTLPAMPQQQGVERAAALPPVTATPPVMPPVSDGALVSAASRPIDLGADETEAPSPRNDREARQEDRKPPLLPKKSDAVHGRDKFGCPKGMVFIPGGRFTMGSSASDEFHNFSDKLLTAVDVRPFCIDRLEFPGVLGQLPQAVSLKQARAACEAKSARLCIEEEWERACKGPKGTRFPYGDQFDEGECNVGGTDGGARPVRPVGQAGGCRSGFGVFDLSGNVAEWTESRMPGSTDYIVKGGDASRPDYASRCANRSALSAGAKHAWLGVRCCADPE